MKPFPAPDRQSLGHAAGARHPQAVGAVCSRGGPAVRGTFSLRFVVCRARFPGLRYPGAVVAWHLSLCSGFGRRRASLACLVALD